MGSSGHLIAFRATRKQASYATEYSDTPHTATDRLRPPLDGLPAVRGVPPHVVDPPAQLALMRLHPCVDADTGQSAPHSMVGLPPPLPPPPPPPPLSPLIPVTQKDLYFIIIIVVFLFVVLFVDKSHGADVIPELLVTVIGLMHYHHHSFTTDRGGGGGGERYSNLHV